MQQNIKVRTKKAYAVETEKQHSAEMMRILKEACKDTHEFVPFYMRKKHPEAFCKTIIENTRIMSENRTIVLHNIGHDAMYYLRDRIASIQGVQDIQPCPSVTIDGKYKLMVKIKDFNSVRSTLMDKLQPWYDEHVAEDAKQLASQFPGDPQVAPIASDGYSSSEDSYTASSVNTALSYSSTLSDLTQHTNSTKQSQATDTSKLPSASNTWASKVSNPTQRPIPPVDKINTNFNGMSIDATYISDLQSSRAEVDNMRNQLSAIEKEKEAMKLEMARQADQYKRELEIQQKEQQLEMQRQVDQQRREFEQQLSDQKQQLEQQSRQQRQELEERLSQQIANALQSHLQPPPPPNVTPTTVIQLPPEFYRMVENQDRQLQRITTILSRQSDVPGTAAIKRNQSIIDLTMDHHELENKKQDLKATPQHRPRNISLKRVIDMVDSVHTAQGMSPESTISNTQDEFETDNTSTWDGYHSPSAYQSPLRHNERNRGSPCSNLATHQMYRSPGDGPGDDSMRAEVHYQESPIPGDSLNDSEFSDQHMDDIVAQHHQRDGNQSHKEAAIPPQEKEHNIARSPQPEGDTTGEYQAKPVEHLPNEYNHEL